MDTPVDSQLRVIEEPGNCVVIAGPGSGKTATLAWKIRAIIPSLPEWRGIIAISYTNKASDELRARCLEGGTDPKASFFGTMHKFNIVEIIVPFGVHLFGKPQWRLNITSRTLSPEETDMHAAAARFRDGELVLSDVEGLAFHILRQSPACQRYLKARYSHIIVDEYQDCGVEQHGIFNILTRIGLVGIAVGDPNQSIFRFARKDPKYLIGLAGNEGFTSYYLEENHRSHASITNYAMRLLSSKSKLVPADGLHILGKRVEGDEADLARWVGSVVPAFVRDYALDGPNQVAVVVTNNRNAEAVAANLGVPHKLYRATALDQEFGLWSEVFQTVLGVTLDPSLSRYEALERYVYVDTKPKEAEYLLGLLGDLRTTAAAGVGALRERVDAMIQIAGSIYPHAESADAVNALRTVLQDPGSLAAYQPARADEVQVMTIHKAKGLEFGVVFHLDLYDGVLPYRLGDPSLEDIDLHYVAITRARKCCILCTSSKRHLRDGRVVDATPSALLRPNGLPSLRRECQL